MRTPDVVDRRLVHKCNPENVVLADLRLAVPSRLEAKVLADVEGRDRAAGECLRRHYVPASRTGTDGECVVLAGLAPILRVTRAALAARLSALPPEQSDEHLAMYDRDGDQLVLLRDADEWRYEKLLVALGLAESLLPEAEKLRISRALRLLDDPPRAYCATLAVDTAHEFFFEHVIEHVPGLLIIEAARQMAIAVEHEFRRTAADVQFILEVFSAEFQGYVEHCIPAELFCRETSRGASRPGRPACGLGYEIVVHQLRSQAARFTIAGDTITASLFDRLRRNRTPTLAGRVFVPRSHAVAEVVLGAEGEAAGRATASAVWLEGVRLRFADPFSTRAGDHPFTLSFPELPKIAGRLRVTRHWQRDDGAVFADAELVELDRAAQQVYQKAIATYCVWTGEETTALVPANAAQAAVSVVS